MRRSRKNGMGGFAWDRQVKLQRGRHGRRSRNLGCGLGADLEHSPTKQLVVFPREPRTKRATHAKFSHVHAGEDWQLVVLLEVRGSTPPNVCKGLRRVPCSPSSPCGIFVDLAGFIALQARSRVAAELPQHTPTSALHLSEASNLGIPP